MYALRVGATPSSQLVQRRSSCFLPSFGSEFTLRQTPQAWGRQTCSGAPGTSGRDVHVAAAPAVASQAGTPPPAGKPAKKKVKKLVDINGDVTKDLGNGMFQVKLENGVSVMAHLSGKIRQNRIKIVTGDKVTVELSPYDLTRGRITYRFKAGELPGANGGAPTPAAGQQ
mmetsp:Transcript_9974/g.24924  ORF Transcript_9974/g.24924 Transcript_9974/m.24924 type:complete len:170 (-) Transcript_9974:707-1216(-)